MLVVHSYYSLLRGTSSPSALADRAAELGIRALALADDEGLMGAVEFWKRCKEVGVRPILGATVGGRVYLARDRNGYANLCRLITRRKCGESSVPCPTSYVDGDSGLWTSDVGHRTEDVGRIRHVYFARREEWKIHQLLSAIRENALFGEAKEIASPEAYLRPGDEPEPYDWEFLPAPKIFPRFGGGIEELRALSRKGLAWRYPAEPPFERACRELEVIGKLGYADYFLVVHDIVQYAREKGVPIAGRGSGASSVVAYALGITNVDPIAFDLPFERFLHEGRTDFPDLDIDFCRRIRDDILAYVFRRFGDVAMVSTHITFQRRSAFREAAKAFGYSDDQVTAMQRGRARPPGLLRIRRAAEAILGVPRHLSVHCGGVVLHPDGAAPMQRAEKGLVVTQYDKDSVEEAGLVKIDLLGNRALSTIRETIEIAERTTGLCIDAEHLPHDEATVRLLQEGRTLGCNQLESPAMRALLRMMRPADVRGVMRALALIRPGAASQGMKERFIRRARGLEASPPSRLLADTYGVMLYEDDAMIVASALAGLSLAEGDRFRRRVQKLRTDEERLAVSREFLGLCSANGTPPDLAADLWVQMAKFNEFSFCRAHAASYAVLAWASAWLAVHHPVAHWVAALNNNQGLYDARVYLEEAKRQGIEARLPCIQKSGVEFTAETSVVPRPTSYVLRSTSGEEEGDVGRRMEDVGRATVGGAIRIGLNRVFGIERREIEAILEGRPFESLEDFLARVKLSKPSLRNLVLSGALDWTGIPRPRLLMRALSRGGEAPEIPDFSEETKFRYELEILGLSARRHPLHYLYGLRPIDSRSLIDHIGRRIEIVGIMATARIAMTANEQAMEFLTLEDEHGLFEVTLFPDVYRRYRSLVGTLGPYLVEGKVEERYDAIAIDAARIERAGPPRAEGSRLTPVAAPPTIRV